MYFTNDMKNSTAVICDISTTSTRFGMSGEDSPRYVYPSMVGTIDEVPDAEGMDVEDTRYILGRNIHFRRDNMVLRPILTPGPTYDFELVEEMLNFGFN